MKIRAVALATAAGPAIASAKRATKPQRLPSEISAASDLGQSVLSRARRLDQEDGEEAYTWIAGYSLKFQGCRHHATLNLDADDENDVRVQTTNLAHFRLCPAGTCTASKAGGCAKGYGDYVVDLATFAKAFVEGRKRSREYECKIYAYESCNCQEGDDQDDGFDRDYCEYDCYAANDDYLDCIDRNPYADDEEDDRDRFEAQEYAECREWEAPEFDDDDGGRRLEDAEEESLYIGPYCSSDGGKVYLGMFTDETCTNFADGNWGMNTYKELSGGEALPYGAASLVTADCVACIELEDPDRRDEGDDDGEEEVEASDQCAELYRSAGKCESGMDVASSEYYSGYGFDADEAACSYIEGIKFTRVDGIVEGRARASGAATAWIVFFAIVFGGMAVVVYNLRERAARARRGDALLGKAKEVLGEGKPLS